MYWIEINENLQNVTTPPSLPRGVHLLLLVRPRLRVCLLLSRCDLIKFRDILDVSLLYECLAGVGTVGYGLALTQCAVEQGRVQPGSKCLIVPVILYQSVISTQYHHQHLPRVSSCDHHQQLVRP